MKRGEVRWYRFSQPDKKRPVVIDDAIAIRSMVYISMSYDHRIIDGALGGLFMQKVVYYLENFDVTQAV